MPSVAQRAASRSVRKRVLLAPVVDRDARRRPDWRATAHALVAGGRPDFVMVVPASNTLLLSVYLPLRRIRVRPVRARKIAVVRLLLDVGGRPVSGRRGARLPGFSLSRQRPSRQIELLIHRATRRTTVTPRQRRRIAGRGRPAARTAAETRGRQ